MLLQATSTQMYNKNHNYLTFNYVFFFFADTALVIFNVLKPQIIWLKAKAVSFIPLISVV